MYCHICLYCFCHPFFTALNCIAAIELESCSVLQYENKYINFELTFDTF